MDAWQSQSVRGEAPSATVSVQQSELNAHGRRITPQRRTSFRRFEELGVLVALALMFLVVSVFHPQFRGVESVANLLQQAAFYGIIAIGMVFALSMGEVDLSVGGTMALSATSCSLMVKNGVDPWLGALIALAVGVALGAFNALVANSFGLPLIIVTLGTLSMFRGAALVISGGQTITGGNNSSQFFKLFGASHFRIPAAALAFALIAVLATLVYKRGAFAFSVRAVGSNLTAARLSGYPIQRIRLYVASLVGLCAATAGVLSYAYFQATDPSLGYGIELQAIAAAVIGGTALSGGRGSIVGAVLGALIISVIGGALTQFGVSANWVGFVTGAVIVSTVALDAVIKRRQRLDN